MVVHPPQWVDNTTIFFKGRSIMKFNDCFSISVQHIKFIGERNNENGQYKVTLNDNSEIILDDKYDELVTEWLQHRVDIVVENERLAKINGTLRVENERLRDEMVAPTDSGIVTFDSLCEEFNTGNRTLASLCCALWNGKDR